ncbi:MAG: alpha/beta fold hydrolase [Dehalococcoidia bacterium]
MPFVHANDVDLYYEDQGAGEPLLLLTGFATHLSIWRSLLATLTASFRVVTLDNRGMGRSAMSEAVTTTRQMADDAVAVLDALGIDRAHVLGWSMGGMIAQELALACAQRVDRLVLLASVARAHPTFERWLTAMTQGYRQVEAGALEAAAFHLSMLPWLYSPAFMARLDAVETIVQHALADRFPPTAAGVAAQAEACRRHTTGDILDRLPAITTPTLVLVGAEDIVTPRSYAEQLVDAIATARLQVIDGGGHGVALEAPEAVSDAVLKFIG